MGVLTNAATKVERHWMWWLAAVAAALLAGPPLLVSGGAPWWVFLLIGIGCAASALSVFGIERRNSDLKDARDEIQTELEEARAEGRAEEQILLGNLLPRTLERLHDLQASSRAAERSGAYRGLVADIIGRIQGMYSEDEAMLVRVNYYRLMRDEDGVYLGVIDRHTTVNRTRLDESTPEGKLILHRVLGGDDVYCGDLDDPSQAEHIAEPGRHHDYRCFASIVVRSGNTGYGMLSANTPDPEGLPESSLKLLSVFGGILAIAEAINSDPGLYRAPLEGHDIIGPMS